MKRLIISVILHQLFRLTSFSPSLCLSSSCTFRCHPIAVAKKNLGAILQGKKDFYRVDDSCGNFAVQVVTSVAARKTALNRSLPSLKSAVLSDKQQAVQSALVVASVNYGKSLYLVIHKIQCYINNSQYLK